MSLFSSRKVPCLLEVLLGTGVEFAQIVGGAYKDIMDFPDGQKVEAASLQAFAFSHQTQFQRTVLQSRDGFVSGLTGQGDFHIGILRNIVL